MHTRFFLLCSSLIFGIWHASYAEDLIIANVVISTQTTGQSSTAASSVSDSSAAEPPVINESGQPSLDNNPEQSSLKSTIKIIKSTPIKTGNLIRYKLSQKSLKEPEQPSQYQLQGYVNKQYVYLVVEKAKADDQQVVGYMFDGKGNKKYVFGEWVNNTLQVYEPSKAKGSSVLLNEQPTPSTSNSPFSNEQQFIERNSGHINR